MVDYNKINRVMEGSLNMNDLSPEERYFIECMCNPHIIGEVYPPSSIKPIHMDELNSADLSGTFLIPEDKLMSSDNPPPEELIPTIQEDGGLKVMRISELLDQDNNGIPDIEEMTEVSQNE